MDIYTSDYKISSAEEVAIKEEVKQQLVKVLYQYIPSGVGGAYFVTTALLFTLYNYANKPLLITWFLTFNLIVSCHYILYKFFNETKEIKDVKIWQYSFYTFIVLCALTWGQIIFIIPDNIKIQTIIFCLLFGIAAAYTYLSTGHHILCAISVSALSIEVMLWCFHQEGFYFYMGFIVAIYGWFLLQVNKANSKWLTDYLELSQKTSLATYQATHDLLTDLPNQKLLEQQIEIAINKAKEDNSKFGVVCVSLNRLSVINDSYGHHVVNQIIKVFAKRLKENFPALNERNSIALTRWDIFIIVLEYIDSKQLEKQAKSIFSLLDDPFHMEAKSLKLTASIGMSTYPKDGDTAEILLMNADLAMRHAKELGGNNIGIYQKELNKITTSQVELESHLHAALKKSEFYLNFQPLINISNGKIDGLEALTRWQHPTLGFISPDKFIPLAEDIGLIIPLGEWILREACTYLSELNQKGYKDLSISVNISAKQLQQENILSVVNEILKETKINPEFLELELTESLMLNQEVSDVLKEFKKMGIKLSLDDFGTGYASLNYIRNFCVDKIKIDKSFIDKISLNEETEKLIATIFNMSKALNLKTVAEGVETKEQLEFVKKYDCDIIQGYYFSKPLDKKALLTYLKDNYHKDFNKI